MTTNSSASRDSNGNGIQMASPRDLDLRTSPPSLSDIASPAQRPISIGLTSTGLDRVYPGASYVLGVTVHNHGDQDAVILLFIDERSPQLRQWCPAMQKRLALAAGQTGEVIFEFQIPPEALPEILSFDLIADASDSYANLSPIRLRNRQLQVLAAEQRQESANDPTFWLTPSTAPDEPLVVQPGVATPLEIRVENRSNLVDRFRLICSGLPDHWKVAITYPQDETNLGLVTAAKSLGLNPGDRGQILVTITAPETALAGNYIPTFRLHCTNQPELGLLDLCYLQVQPYYALTPQINAVQRDVKLKPARFELNLANLGNTERYLRLELQDLDEKQSCQYKIACNELKILPRSVAQVPITGLPQGRWQRPWFGPGKTYNFRLHLADAEQHPLTPASLEGYLTWKARPLWQLLLVLLTSLGVLGVLIWAIWSLFFRTPTPPKALEFAAADSQYTALQGDVARVNWRIHNPQQLKAIQITGYGSEGEVKSGPLEFDLAQGLPAALKPFCREGKTTLSCRSVRTDAFEPGDYRFELALIPKANAQPPILAESNPVTIAAKPLPTVTKLVPTALVYNELGRSPGSSSSGSSAAAADSLPTVTPSGLSLNWEVSAPNQLASLRLTGKTAEGESLGELIYDFPAIGGEVVLPTELSQTCRLAQTLTCQNIPTGVSAVGKYQFELQAIPRAEEQAGLQANAQDGSQAGTQVAAIASDIVTIQPRPPLLRGFFLNGAEAPAKLQIPAAPRGTPPSILLSWAVEAGSSTKVELLPSPGHVPASGNLNLPLPPQGSTTLTLQITDTNTGKTTSRATTIETFDPMPPDPEAIAIAAAANAARVSSAATAAIMEQQAKATAAIMAQQAEALAANNAAAAASRNAAANKATGDADSNTSPAQQASRRLLKQPKMPLSPAELPPQLQ